MYIYSLLRIILDVKLLISTILENARFVISFDETQKQNVFVNYIHCFSC
jgi:hypothetical protein